MSLETSPVDSAETSLLEEGFFDFNDTQVGDHLKDFEQKDFPFFKQEGISFIKQHILLYKDLQTIVNRYFGDQGCVLAHCLRYGSWPGHIESFISAPGRCALIFDLLPKGSRISYFAGSHLQGFRAAEGARRTRELSLDALQEAGCRAQTKDLKLGGSVILDARVAREISEGYAITTIFTTEEVVKRFKMPPMVLPDLPGLRKDVEEMRKLCPKIKLNFEFQ